MPLSTHLSSDPEMFQATASQRNLTPSKPVHSSKQKQQRLSKPNPGQISPSLGRNSTAHGASTNSLNPGSEPGLSLRARANQTNRSPQLAFAAAVIAASLQLFTLPGLAIESQQNPTQLGNSSNTEIMYTQNNLPNSYSGDAKTNLNNIYKIVSLSIGLLSLYLILKEVPGLKKKIDIIQGENNNLNNKLIEAEDQRKEVTQKVIEIANILSK